MQLKNNECAHLKFSIIMLLKLICRYTHYIDILYVNYIPNVYYD